MRSAGDPSHRAFRLVRFSRPSILFPFDCTRCDAFALRREDCHAMSSPGSTAAAAAKGHDSAEAPRGRFSRKIVLLAGGLSAVVVLGGLIAWFLSGPPEITPQEQFQTALQKLDAKDLEAATDLAKTLQDAQFHPEEFPGGVAYILGMAAYQEAETDTDLTSESRTAQYTVAASFLREAGQSELPEDRRPEWCFALGKSLLDGKEFSAAGPLLEEAFEHHPPRKAAAAKLLADIYLKSGDRTPELLGKALELNTAALAETTDTVDRDYVLLQRSDILVGLNRPEEAEAALAEVKATEASRFGSILLKGWKLIQDRRFAEAISVLKPVGESTDGDPRYPRQALYLMGFAADQLVHQHPSGTAAEPHQLEVRHEANEYFQKTIDRFEGSDEAFASQVMLGRLQQEDGAHEKSLRTFSNVLRSIRRAEDFQNRWLKIEDVRQQVLAAWNEWTQQGRYAEAVAMTELMIPLFARDQANELTARVRQRAAEALSEELAELPFSERKRRRGEERRRWCDSGKAYAELAESRRDSVNHTNALWTSAEHFARGHDFTKSLAQYDDFLAQGIDVEAERPVAMVRRAQVLLDLDRPDEALASVDDILETMPTSPYVFVAQLLRGQCLLELDRRDDAEVAWRGMLTASGLTPAATEWRDALHSLAKLLTDTAALEKRKAFSRNDDEPVDPETQWNAAAARSKEAIARWAEYLDRYPESPHRAEAQYYFGKSLHLQAEWIERQSVNAETDNARQQTQSQFERALERAMVAFKTVRDELTPEAQRDRLNDLDAEILQSAWFELPHAQYQLGRYQKVRYEEAIAAYTAAVNRYPQDVRVLTAYVQMAQAYSHLGKNIEARSVLEQAKVIMDQQQIPTTAFTAPTTNLTRNEWELWLDRVRQVQQ